MKLFSMGAHRYPISHLSWTDYAPHEDSEYLPSYETTLYGERVKLTPLPVAIPATISYLSIAETLENQTELSVIGNNLGDTEWNRVFGLINNNLSKVHMIGSLEGVWEGTFTVSHAQTHNGVSRYSPIMSSTLISRRTTPSFGGRAQTSWSAPLSRATVIRSKCANTSCSNQLRSTWGTPWMCSYQRDRQ